jgi:hypothetical protein
VKHNDGEPHFIDRLLMCIASFRAFQQALSFCGDLSSSGDCVRYWLSPGGRGQRKPGGLATFILQRWQRSGATIKADRPASLAAHFLGSHLTLRFFDARLEMRPFFLGEFASARCGEPSARIFGCDLARCGFAATFHEPRLRRIGRGA